LPQTQDAPSPSQTTSGCNIGSASSSRPLVVAEGSASECPSNTASLTSAAAKAAAPATAEHGRTSSTSAVRPPCRTWKRSTAGSREPRTRTFGGQRDDSTFNPFGALGPTGALATRVGSDAGRKA